MINFRNVPVFKCSYFIVVIDKYNNIINYDRWSWNGLKIDPQEKKYNQWINCIEVTIWKKINEDQQRKLICKYWLFGIPLGFARETWTIVRKRLFKYNVCIDMLWFFTITKAHQLYVGEICQHNSFLLFTINNKVRRDREKRGKSDNRWWWWQGVADGDNNDQHSCQLHLSTLIIISITTIYLPQI